ncbi:helix-turn-helix domain-containing protein [Chryseobacterium sp. CFBP8996]|uniref:helix-turn-helix domain-containing protein n=1 Tax=Chryseobacterium sp. CFBP8996 TaxID=3096529 RepID=UPI002A6ACC3E|nr:helix-turn-helix domain-containing protein [Chryseobacterium sp. CFBP8996]MDY0931631.1 helix-turn-helix domain-containing protein [Chryseobacterium sp. CFBP8996]
MLKQIQNLSILEKQEQLSLLQTKNILTTEGAALYLSISVPTLRELRRNKKIASYQPSRKVFYKREDLDDWLLNSKQSDESAIQSRVSGYFLKSKF